MLSKLPPIAHPSLLVGVEHSSDAAVWKLDENRALVQTVDFFTPIVDDPRTFGRIAAANSISDVYAVGGEPLTALALVCFPDTELPAEVLVEILKGGDEKVREAGALIVGGHSVRDPELKYGLSVTGLVDPKNVRTKEAARPGDVLVLTKPLGTGLIANAIKAGKVSDKDAGVVAAIRSMEHLNGAGSRVLTKHGVKASTDITGFGLVGHALTFAEGSKVGFTLRVSALPVLELALDLAKKPLAGGSKDNEDSYAPSVDRASGLDEKRVRLAFDAQTSGGLLAAVPKDKVDAVVKDLAAAGTIVHAVIGEVTAEGVGRVRLV